MAKSHILVICTLATSLFPARWLAIAQNIPGRSSQWSPQVDSESLITGGAQDRALPVAPSLNASPQRGDTAEIPAIGHLNTDPKSTDSRPYLGITTQPVERCYIGREEHGMEIMTVDPGGPADVAGLRGCTPSTPHSGVARHQLDLALSSFAQMWEVPRDGDLIIAINDQRVRSQAEMNAAMANLKPGDVVYLTVIRPTSTLNHETLKMLVHVGRWTGPIASASHSSP